MKTLEANGTRASLEQVLDFVRDVSAEAGLAGPGAYHLQLAVDEIATNIVVHGYEEAGLTGPLTVSARWDDGYLTVELVDVSRPYDPRQRAAPPSLDLDLEDRPIGGLGVFLALKSVDRFDYFTENGRNHCVFAMKLLPPAGAAGA